MTEVPKPTTTRKTSPHPTGVTLRKTKELTKKPSDKLDEYLKSKARSSKKESVQNICTKLLRERILEHMPGMLLSPFWGKTTTSLKWQSSGRSTASTTRT